jgi:TolB-like protein
MPDLSLKVTIEDELEKILASNGFKRSPLLSRFLRFVVENTLDGNSNQIKEYTVAVKVLGKPLNFNPQLDASVRINAIRLRNMLTEYYQENKNDVTYHIELPKGRYIPIFTQNGKEPALYPDSSQEEDSGAADIICIMPFSGLVQHPSLDFSIPGFCEFLSEKLSQFEDIQVVSFHSALKFTNEGGRLEHAGTSLGVFYYLTGSVEVDEEQLIISFQLFDAKKNIIIWSKHTSASLLQTRVMEAADTITNQVVSSLAGYSGFLHYRKVLDKNRVPPLTNKMANAIFWFYNYHVYQSEELYYAAIKRLEEVVKIDGDCALCWAVLSNLYADALIYNYTTNKSPLEAAIICVEKAFALDPHCQHAHLAYGWIQIILRNKIQVLATIEKIDQINPNSSTFKAMCSLGLAFLGEYSKSLASLEYAKKLNPLPYWWMNLPETFLALKAGNFEKVIYLARKSSTPRMIFEHLFEMIGLYYLDHFAELTRILRVYKTHYPNGLLFVENALRTVLLDDELVEIISKALKEIDKIEISNNNQ